MSEQQTLSLAVETIGAFKAALRGTLLCPGVVGYDVDRRIYHGPPLSP
jgi:hypothetical protein